MSVREFHGLNDRPGIGAHDQGRTAARAGDIAPHRLPREALDWPGFVPLGHDLTGWPTRAS